MREESGFFSHTVTVYHRQETGEEERWTAWALHGVCWQEKRRRKKGTAAVPAPAPASVVTVYIPQPAMGCGETNGLSAPTDGAEDAEAAWMICPGDLVKRGIGPLEIEGASLRGLPGGRMVTAVTFHDAPGELSHWEVTAE